MTRRIEGYREPIACTACGHRQQPTLLWLTCEYCGIVLEEHPHFKKEKNYGEWPREEKLRVS